MRTLSQEELETLFDHRQIPIIDPDGDPTYLDEQMVEPVQELWRLGLITYYSCEGFDSRRKIPRLEDRAYILFEETAEIHALVSALRSRYDFWGSAPVVVEVEDLSRKDFRELGRIVHKNAFLVETDNGCDGTPPRVCLRFPKSHLLDFASFLRELEQL